MIDIKKIIDNRDYFSNTGDHPEPGQYYITGAQVNNLQGQLGWDHYVGYVVQIRKKWGAFGSDLVIMRHPGGFLQSHENQSFYPVKQENMNDLLEYFGEVTPEDWEDYSQPYYIAGEYPEIGKIIELKENRPAPDNRPLVKIRVTHSDGSEYTEIC